MVFMGKSSPNGRTIQVGEIFFNLPRYIHIEVSLLCGYLNSWMVYKDNPKQVYIDQYLPQSLRGGFCFTVWELERITTFFLR